MDKEDVPSSTLFSCDLMILDTNYYEKKEKYWQKGKNKSINKENLQRSFVFKEEEEFEFY